MRVLARLASPLIGCTLLLTAAAGPAAASSVVSPNGTALPACGHYVDDLTPDASYGDWQTTLLDTILRIPKSYAPPDLVPISNAGINRSGKIRSLAIDDLREMTSAASAAGAPIAATSSYRSYSNQVSLFNRYVKADGYNVAVTFSARPGHSEHQLGTAMDFKSKGGTDPWNLHDWASTPAGKWMMNNAWTYGWVLSYPKDGQKTTCYVYEPWHYRYFGRAQAAEMHDSGLSTRAYLWQLGSGDQTGTSAPEATISDATVGTKRLTTTTVPVTVAWSSSDPSKVAAYTLQQKVDSDSWTNVMLANPTATSVTLLRAPGKTYLFRVRDSDAQGDVSDWSTSDALNLSMVAEDDPALTYAGTWQTESSTAYFGGAETYSLTAGDSVSYSFSGSSFAWVGKKATDRGAAQVYVDGTLIATVDTHRSRGMARTILYSQSWSQTGDHAVQLVVVGTEGRPRVDLDGFVVAN